MPCPIGSVCYQYGSNQETVSTTILKEAGYDKKNENYDAVAWVIYNRMQNPTNGGCGTFPTNPKAFPTNPKGTQNKNFK